MNSFAIDKANAAVYEGIAIDKIESWYRRQGFIIGVRYNEANGLEAKRGFDLIDQYGKKWEVKCDRLWGTTGNVFLERQALEHSQADYFLILAGWGYVLTREQILQLLDAPQYRRVTGGDNNWSQGTLIPVAELAAHAEIA